MRENKYTVSSEGQCFRDLKAYYIEQAKTGWLNMVQEEFRGLDRVAMSYAGVCAQTPANQKAIVKAARSAGHEWKTNQFPVALKRMSVPYWRLRVSKGRTAAGLTVPVLGGRRLLNKGRQHGDRRGHRLSSVTCCETEKSRVSLGWRAFLQ